MIIMNLLRIAQRLFLIFPNVFKDEKVWVAMKSTQDPKNPFSQTSTGLLKNVLRMLGKRDRIEYVGKGSLLMVLQHLLNRMGIFLNLAL